MIWIIIIIIIIIKRRKNVRKDLSGKRNFKFTASIHIILITCVHLFWLHMRKSMRSVVIVIVAMAMDQHHHYSILIIIIIIHMYHTLNGIFYIIIIKIFDDDEKMNVLNAKENIKYYKTKKNKIMKMLLLFIENVIWSQIEKIYLFPLFYIFRLYILLHFVNIYTVGSWIKFAKFLYCIATTFT